MKLFKRKPHESEDLRTCPFCKKAARVTLHTECYNLVCRVSCTKGCAYRSRSLCKDDFTKEEIDELVRLTIEDWNKRGE